MAKVDPQVLRHKEWLGLLQPAARSEGGFRYYRPTDVNRVRLIWDLQELGLHLDQIATLLARRDEGTSRDRFFEGVRAALREHDRLLEEKIRSLEGQREKVREAVHKLVSCETCGLVPAPQNNHCEPCSQTQSSLPELLSALF